MLKEFLILEPFGVNRVKTLRKIKEIKDGTTN
jgi:hypothetical protein